MGLLNIAGLGSSLPVNAYAVLNLVNGRSYGQGGLPEISGVLSSLSSLTAGAYSANHVYTPTDASWASQELVMMSCGDWVMNTTAPLRLRIDTVRFGQLNGLDTTALLENERARSPALAYL
jgi:hypothetical protein